MTAPASPLVDGLQRVLAAQHAAVFGYPVIGVHAGTDALAQLARDLEAAHRLTRDQLAAQLVGLGAEPVAADVEYQPPVPITQAGAPARWAVRLEEAAAAGYRYLLRCAVQAGTPGDPVRSQAYAGLAGAAAAGSSWQQLLTPATPTVPFPGTT